jgi:hypothetical protein
MPLLSAIRSRLSQKNGEGNVSDSTRLSTYDELIRETIDDIRSRQPWSFDNTTLNVVFNSSGVSTTTLTNFTIGCLLDARKVNTGTDDDNVYSLIDSWEADKYSTSDYPIWVTGNDVDGWELNIKDTDSRTLQISYVQLEDALTNPTDETRIPINVIVKGAYALLRRSDNYEAQTDRERADYEDEITKLKKKEDRYPKRAISRSENENYAIGDV